MPESGQYPLAVLADIHGNADALAAVLLDARQRGAVRFVNLGDTFYGPLDPAETWRMLRAMPMEAVLGNQDRILLDPDGPMAGMPAFRAAREALGGEGLAWLAALPATLVTATTRVTDRSIFLCHGTPASDTAYLLEDVATGRPVQRDRVAIETDLTLVPPGCTLVLAGHSHHQGMAVCGRITVVNPGSVGLPAYDDDAPPHAMASGSPHARYALLSPSPSGWDVLLTAVPYDWERAARLAQANGRSDWARWLATGLA
ncbi:MAG: metallophosphatase family protein [Pseudodesulfovibrio sp.]|nr:metallophosphatase family protein [Pseudomonadota bacterium]MBV1763635.1 metallophosphatase family protein [Pseudodesulfovibrio sp.]MBU4245167.1 metallophosphatase family protein [Pseudomonadota bacterium]MBU4377998.1 metallophosphatase family protein [Pseudomonadota bacterium]MBU4475485.1 metallophosphatase family protein [Pseudomonadota bacterium]